MQRAGKKLSLALLIALAGLFSTQAMAQEKFLGLITKPKPKAKTESSILVGTIAKNFVLTDITGKVDSLNAYKGQPVVLQLWATWCKDSKASSPFVQKLYETYSSQGVTFLTVSVGTKWRGLKPEKTEDITAFMTEHGYTFPVFIGDRDIRELYHAGHIPDLFFISKTGLIRAVYTEYAPGAEDIEKDLRRFIEEQK